MLIMEQCPKCKKEKAPEEFKILKGIGAGCYTAHCWECFRIMRDGKAAVLREERLEACREYVQEVRARRKA